MYDGSLKKILQKTHLDTNIYVFSFDKNYTEEIKSIHSEMVQCPSLSDKYRHKIFVFF